MVQVRAREERVCVCVCVEICHNTICTISFVHSTICTYCFAHSRLVVVCIRALRMCNPCITFFYYALNGFVRCWWRWCVYVYFALRDDVLPSIFHLKIHTSRSLFSTFISLYLHKRIGHSKHTEG